MEGYDESAVLINGDVVFVPGMCSFRIRLQQSL